MDHAFARANRPFAAFLDLGGRRAVVVGGGRLAANRCEALIASGAAVRVIAPSLCPRLEALRSSGAVRHEARCYRAGDLAGADLAFAATADAAVDAAVADEAKAARVLVNVAGESRLSSLDVPMVVERLSLTVAISARAAGGDAARRGLVTLVGCGPGDPGLLTLRALEVMQRADVVLHDHLVPPAIVALAASGAERIDVGKERDRHTLPQGEINRIMVRLAREGRRVVRLKGGDPLLFGRGGEEAEELTAHGVDFEIVPGVTAAAGAGACAGIPLTHRDCAHACVFVTGHLKDDQARLDWEALARPNQTVVVYMGLHGIAPICTGLLAHGLPHDWPAAIVERASLPGQRVIEGTLASLPSLAVREQVRSPALLILGEVVRRRLRPSRSKAAGRLAPAPSGAAAGSTAPESRPA